MTPYPPQDTLSMLFQDMAYIFIYMNDLFIISNDTFENHTDILDDVLKWPEKPRTNFNEVKPKWSHDSVGYLGFMVIGYGINVYPSKVKLIMVI